jgi:hypothetical protein
MTGENGFAQTIIFFSNILESWNSKLNTFAYNAGKLSEAEWLGFYAQSEEWLETLNRATHMIGKPTKDHEEGDGDGKKSTKSKRVLVIRQEIPFDGCVLLFQGRGDDCLTSSKQESCLSSTFHRESQWSHFGRST